MKHLTFSLLLVSALSLSACDKPSTAQKTPEQPATPATPATTATAPVATNDLSAETAEYKKWVEGQIDLLLADTEKFVGYLNAGNLAEAKKIYPLARMYFERSEPIAESFGDLDPRIDNREADLEKGEVWTGFHAIEKTVDQ